MTTNEADQNAPKFIAAFFVGIEDNLVQPLVMSLRDNSGALIENPALQMRYQAALDAMDVPQEYRESHDSVIIPRGKISLSPLAALLSAQYLGPEDGEATFERLRALTIAAVVIIRSWERGEYHSPIKGACDAVRLLGTKNPDCLAGLSEFKLSIDDAYYVVKREIDALHGRQNIVWKRLLPIRVLFKKFVFELAEIRKTVPNKTSIQAERVVTDDDQIAFEWIERKRTSPEHCSVAREEYLADEIKDVSVVEFERCEPNSAAARAPSIKRKYDLVSSHLMNRRRQHHTCELSRMTADQVRFFYAESKAWLERYCVRPKLQNFAEFDEMLFSHLSLLTGRRQERLRNLPMLNRPKKTIDECWLLKGAGVFLLYKPRIARSQLDASIFNRRAIDLAATFDVLKTEHFHLPVEPSIARALALYHQMRSLASTESGDGKEVQGTAMAKLLVGIRRSQLASFLGNALRDTNADHPYVSVLTGSNTQNHAGIYYTQLSSVRILEIYRHAFAEYGVDLSECEVVARPVGTAMVPKEAFLKEIFKRQSAFLKQGRFYEDFEEQVFYHNRYTEYVYQVLVLATGHRPVRCPFGSLRDLDLVSGFLMVSDKDSEKLPRPRFLPICETAQRQMANYLQYVKGLKERYQYVWPELKHQIEAVQAGEQPFLFLMKGDVPDGFTFHALDPKELEHYSMETMPLPLNWQRHYIRTHLTDQLDGEVIDAFMGHGQFGQESNSRTSGLPIARLAAVSPRIDALFQRLEVEVV